MGAKNTPESFWARVAIGTPDGCWLWRGAVNSSGYGSVSWAGRVFTAHRLAAWLSGLVVSPSRPSNLCGRTFILHKCDTPRCCNPSHFELGTQRKNQKDAYSRGLRTPLRGGHDHPNAKLTPVQVQNIRNEYESGGAIQTALAAKYGVSQRCVSLICRRESYTWIV